MDIEAIKIIVTNKDIPDELKGQMILNTIAKDENSIRFIMLMLDFERRENRELILDQNSELSRAAMVLNDPHLSWGDKVIASPKWVVGEIKKHYDRWKEKVKCNFDID
jgi:hypothetical protein